MKQPSLTTYLPDTIEFKVFEARPGVGVVLLPDAPKYTLVAVSNDFVQTSGMTRAQVIGKGHFEVFPKSPDYPNFTGEQNLKDSFAYIIQHKVPHQIPLQRYDIPNGDGTFSYRYWKISNAPVLDDRGEVQYIIHTAEDITEQVRAEERDEEHKDLQTAYQKIEESEAKYSSLFNSMDQGFCIIEMIYDEQQQPVDYLFLEINPVFEKQTGLKDAEGKTILQMVPGHDKHWF